MFKKGFNLFLSILCFALFLTLSIIFYKNQNVQLLDYNKYENIVIEKGTDLRYYNKKKNEKVFYIKLIGLEKKVGVYRMFKNYANLENNIKVGEKIKIYYKPNFNKNENINIDVIQIEKKDKVILNKSEYQIKYQLLFIMSVFACLYMILAMISIVRYGNFENIIPPIF